MNGVRGRREILSAPFSDPCKGGRKMKLYNRGYTVEVGWPEPYWEGRSFKEALEIFEGMAEEYSQYRTNVVLHRRAGLSKLRGDGRYSRTFRVTELRRAEI